jgi:hypothetical protein
MENYGKCMDTYGKLWRNLGKLGKFMENLDPFSGLMWIKLVEHDVIYLNHTNLEVCRLKL